MLWEGVVNEDVRALWEGWMVEADKLLEDEELIDLVYEAQGERHEHSPTRGRSQTPAEMALRLLLLKHVRNWSFDTLEREVKMNLAYRDFTRIGLGKVPDAKTLARIAQVLEGEVIAKLHERLVAIAQEKGAVRGRKGQVCASGLVVLEFACHQCPRKGRYQVTRLIDRHGAGMELMKLKDLLSADCRKHGNRDRQRAVAPIPWPV
jgi:Transposase domain (DUF772)